MDKRDEETRDISPDNSTSSFHRPGILHKNDNRRSQETVPIDYRERLKERLKETFEEHRLAFTAVFILQGCK